MLVVIGASLLPARRAGDRLGGDGPAGWPHHGCGARVPAGKMVDPRRPARRLDAVRW